MMKMFAFFCVFAVVANGVRVKQRQKDQSARCNFEVKTLKQCESPAVMLLCKSECEEICDDITEDECVKGNPTIAKMCAKACETVVADSPIGGKKKINCGTVDEKQCTKPRVIAECRDECSKIGKEDELVTDSPTGGMTKINCGTVDEKQCAKPRVIYECREECSKIGKEDKLVTDSPTGGMTKIDCGTVSEKDCEKPRVIYECREECSSFVDEANESNVPSTQARDKCDSIGTLDQCRDFWLEVCSDKCAELLQEANNQPCVDLQMHGEATRVSLKKLLGLSDSQADKILSFQPIFSWEQLERRLNADLNLKNVLLPKLDKAKICKPMGVYEDEAEDIPSPVATVTAEKEPIADPTGGEEPDCVDINGEKEVLMRVRGIGKASAQVILDMKTDGGDFTSWDEFKKRIDTKQRKSLSRGKANAKSNLVGQVRKLIQQKCTLFCSIDGKKPYSCPQ